MSSVRVHALRARVSIKIILQNDRGCQVIQVAAPLAARNTQSQARLLGGLGAAGFIPKLDWQAGLSADGFCQALCLTALGRGLVIVIYCLADHDQASPVFGSKLSNGCRVNLAGDVLQHSQWAGDRSSWVAQSDAKAFFSGVNS